MLIMPLAATSPTKHPRLRQSRRTNAGVRLGHTLPALVLLWVEADWQRAPALSRCDGTPDRYSTSDKRTKTTFTKEQK